MRPVKRLSSPRAIEWWGRDGAYRRERRQSGFRYILAARSLLLFFLLLLFVLLLVLLLRVLLLLLLLLPLLCPSRNYSVFGGSTGACSGATRLGCVTCCGSSRCRGAPRAVPRGRARQLVVRRPSAACRPTVCEPRGEVALQGSGDGVLRAEHPFRHCPSFPEKDARVLLLLQGLGRLLMLLLLLLPLLLLLLPEHAAEVL